MIFTKIMKAKTTTTTKIINIKKINCKKWKIKLLSGGVIGV